MLRFRYAIVRSKNQGIWTHSALLRFIVNPNLNVKQLRERKKKKTLAKMFAKTCKHTNFKLKAKTNPTP